jgi:hypothetical protein
MDRRLAWWLAKLSRTAAYCAILANVTLAKGHEWLFRRGQFGDYSASKSNRKNGVAVLRRGEQNERCHVSAAAHGSGNACAAVKDLEFTGAELVVTRRG